MQGNMIDKHISNDEYRFAEHHDAQSYEIRLKGHLEARWVKWFNGLTISLEEDGNTRLTGLVVDQAAMHGLLKKVRDLGLPLISVNSIEPDAEEVRNT